MLQVSRRPFDWPRRGTAFGSLKPPRSPEENYVNGGKKDTVLILVPRCSLGHNWCKNWTISPASIGRNSNCPPPLHLKRWTVPRIIFGKMASPWWLGPIVMRSFKVPKKHLVRKRMRSNHTSDTAARASRLRAKYSWNRAYTSGEEAASRLGKRFFHLYTVCLGSEPCTGGTSDD